MQNAIIAFFFETAKLIKMNVRLSKVQQLEQGRLTTKKPMADPNKVLIIGLPVIAQVPELQPA